MSESNLDALDAYENTEKQTRKRQIYLISGIAMLIVVALYYGFMMGEESPQKPKVNPSLSETQQRLNQPAANVPAAQMWMAQSGNKLDKLEEENDKLRKEQVKQSETFRGQLDKQNQLLADMQARLEANLEAVKLVEGRSAQSDQTTTTTPNQQPFNRNTAAQPITVQNTYANPQNSTARPPVNANQYPPGNPNAIAMAAQKSGIVISSIKPSTTESSTTSVPGKGSSRKLAKSYFPAGTSSRALIMTGTYAPTGGNATQNPAPILFWVEDVSFLPNDVKGDIIGCLILGNAIGNKTTQRGDIRLMTASCVNANTDEVIEESIHGYVVGEDGRNGIKGEMIVRSGDALNMALLADIAGGFGRQMQYQSMQTSQTALGYTTTIDPNKALQTGAGYGLGRSAERLGNYYIRLAEEMQPVIDIGAGRDVHIVFTKGVNWEANDDEKQANAQANNMQAQSPLPMPMPMNPQMMQQMMIQQQVQQQLMQGGMMNNQMSPYGDYYQ